MCSFKVSSKGLLTVSSYHTALICDNFVIRYVVCQTQLGLTISTVENLLINGLDIDDCYIKIIRVYIYILFVSSNGWISSFNIQYQITFRA